MPLSTPFSGVGSAFSNASGGEANSFTPFTITLDGQVYAITLDGYMRSSLSSLRDSLVPATEPSDALFNNAAAWWRYRHEWDHGSGQGTADLDEDDDPRRFDESLGVDVWQDRLTLLPATEKIHTFGSPTPSAKLVVVGERLILSDGADLYALTDADGSFTDLNTTIAAAINDITTDGLLVYACTDAAIYSYDPATSTLDTLVASGADRLGFVGGRLLAAVGNEIGEVSAAGVYTAFYTAFSANHEWTAIFQIGSRLYIGGAGVTTGSRSEVFILTTTSAGDLAVSAEAFTLPLGERLQGVVSYAGNTVLIQTSAGLRLGVVAGDGAIEYGPVVDDGGAVQAATVDGRFAWFGWGTGIDGASGVGVGRMALDTFVDDQLVGAYATDVYTTEAGGDVVAIARFQGRTFFAASATGVYRDHATEYLESGWLTSGRMFFGTVEDKVLSEVMFRADALEAGQTVSLAVTDPLDAPVATAELITPGARVRAFDLGGATIEYVRVKITLTGNGTSTPALHLWRMRGFPVVPGVQQWIVPIQLFEVVTAGDGMGQAHSLNVFDALDKITALWESKAIVNYREGIRIYKVRVDDYEFVPAHWRDSGDFFEGTLKVRLVSI